MFLIDTNVWLEMLLEQQKCQEVRSFFEDVVTSEMAISEFSIYSIGIILAHLEKDDVFQEFLSDAIEDSGVAIIRLDTTGLKQAMALRKELHLDFDDAYQYVSALQNGCALISFDSDFDGTPLGRKSPSQGLPQ